MVLFENVFPATPSGKVELVSDTLARRWGAAARIADWRGPESTLPLMLISPASDKRISFDVRRARGGVAAAETADASDGCCGARAAIRRRGAAVE